MTVAVKCNGEGFADANELRHYAALLVHPHDNIMPVYGICTDGPEMKSRLVMRLCSGGSLRNYLRTVAAPQVCARGSTHFQVPRAH